MKLENYKNNMFQQAPVIWCRLDFLYKIIKKIKNKLKIKCYGYQKNIKNNKNTVSYEIRKL